MGLHDTFDFDLAAYRAKCAERPTAKLQEEEIRKLRQHFATSASITLGVAHAVQTAGLTIGVSALGLRRYWVAKQKLAIIREELTARGVPLHDMTKRDAGIPLGASVVGIGLGAGVGHLIGGVVDAPAGVPVPGSHHGGGAAMHLVHADPEAAAHGFAQGLADQANAVGQAAHGAVAGLGSGHLASTAAAASDGVLGGHDVGYAAGLAAAKKMEEMLAECVGENVFAYAMEKLLDPEIRLELRLKGKCSRLQGPLGQSCQGCNGSIRHGTFAHCCQGTDDFDLCRNCRAAGRACACEDQPMLTLQKCVSGDVLNSEKGDARRRLATITEMRCKACEKEVTQGRYYYCPECDEGPGLLDLCEECYYKGQTCLSPDKHRLFVYLRANFDRSHPDLTSTGHDCNACKKKIMQGPIFFCKSHDSGICDRCYEMDRTCGDPSHILSRYVVYNGERRITKQPIEKDCCFCKEKLGEDPFYTCQHCDGGSYDLCCACYVKGAGCRDRSHVLSKCTPATKHADGHLHGVLEGRDRLKEYLHDKTARINMLHK